MFCPKCGKLLDDTASFCSECGTSIDTTSKAPQKESNEYVIKEGLCNRIKSALFVQNGHGLLTNKRFIYSKHSLAKIAVMGVLVNATKGTYDFEIAIKDIACLKEGRQGISKTIIICTKSGEEYNFYFNDKSAWEMEFNNLINKNN
ncbi:MAG: zinc-ribbon domain-containing protein [Lachnospira sp.]